MYKENEEVDINKKIQEAYYKKHLAFLKYLEDTRERQKTVDITKRFDVENLKTKFNTKRRDGEDGNDR